MVEHNIMVIKDHITHSLEISGRVFNPGLGMTIKFFDLNLKFCLPILLCIII